MNGKILLKHIAKWRLLYVVLIMSSLSFAGVNAFNTYTPTVISDKDDYQPGDTAIISGYGWIQDQYVDIHFEETPAYHEEHQHDFHDIKVDADGRWTIKYPIEDRHLGVHFEVTAEGKQSKAIAKTFFTDAITWTLTMSPTNVTVGEETTLSFTATLTGTSQGDKLACIKVLIPTGFDYINNSVTDNNNNWASVVTTNSTTGEKTIQVNAEGNNDRLTNTGSSIQFSIKAKANLAIAGTSASWNGTAGTVKDCSNTVIAPTNGQPSVNVSKASQAITFSSLGNKIYGDQPFTLTATASSGLPVVFSVEGPASLGANNLLTITGAGTVTVKANQAGNNNYNAAPEVVRSFSVSKAAASLVLDNLTHTYNATAKAATVTTSPLSLNGVTLSYKVENADESTYSTTAPVNAGRYDVKASLTNANYQATDITGTLIINKANQAITWSNPTGITYGSALSDTQLNAALTIGDGNLTYAPEAGTLLDAGENQTLTVTAAETNNYNAAQASVTINVSRAIPLVSLNVGGPYTYNGSPRLVSSATVAGVGEATLGNATVTYTKDGNPVASPTNAGTYDVIASYGGNSNYESASATGTLVINKATALLSITGLSHTYDGKAKAVNISTTPANLSGITVTYKSGGISVPAANVVNAGSYLYYAEIDNENYTFEPRSGTLIIAKAAMVIKADNATRTYGDDNPVFNAYIVSGAVPGESFDVTASSAAISSSNVGEYDIVPKVIGSTLGNYNVTATKGTLTISKRSITVTAVAGQSKVYGEQDPAVYTYQLTSGSLVDNSHLTGALTRVAGENVGSFAIMQGSLAATSNYALTYNGADFVIGKRAVQITADAKNKTYGDVNPDLTYSITSGSVVNGDAFSGTLNRSGGENVGDYAINLGTLSLGNNYDLTLISGAVLGITPKGITVSPNAGQGKVYGSADPVLTYTNTALVGADAFSGALSREPGSNVGTYNVTQGTLALSSNYSLNFVDGIKFNITPKPLTASISATNKVYDGTTAASATGSVPTADVIAGDVVSVLVGNANFDTKNVGTGKAVNAGVSISNSNYILTSSSASTTANITPAQLTITAPSMSKYCGQADPTSGYVCNVNGAVPGEQIVTSFTIEGTTVKPVCADNKLSNYDVTYVNGTLTINGLTLDASNASYPRSIHEDVVITVSVKDGDTNVSGVSVKLLFDGIVKATATSDANGIATFNLGKLTVNVYAVTAEAGNACSVSPVAYLPIYDPEGGFVTGGGWINSPVGALDGSDVTGKANFGFVAKYKKGNNEVEGNTEFQFQAGSINFKSLAHNAGTLVISGSKATYKGTGTIAGQTGTYEFMVVATDGHVTGGGGSDKFRIKIWNGGQVVYDNARGTLENDNLGDNTILGGGSIVIHENKTLSASNGKKLESAEQLDGLLSARFDNYPNAFADRTTIRFAFDKEQNYALEVYDIRGALVKKVSAGIAEAGKVYEFELDGRNLAEGVYFAKLATGSNMQTIKMLLKK